MAIFDYNAKVVEFSQWYASMYGYTNLRNFKYYYNITDINAVPESSNPSVTVTPVLARTSIQELTNNTSVPQAQTVSFSETTTESQSSTTTNGAKFSTTVTSTTKFTASVKFKAIGSSIEQTLAVAMTGEYNYSSSQTKTTISSRTWTITQPVSVPPRSRVTCTLLIYDAPFAIPVNLNCNIVGTQPFITSTQLVGSTHDFSTPTGTAGTPPGIMYLNNWPGRPSEYIGSGRSSGSSSENILKFRGKGSQTAVQGLYSTVRFDETPLPGNQGETRTYYSPIQLANQDNMIPTNSTSIPIINPV